MAIAQQTKIYVGPHVVLPGERIEVSSRHLTRAHYGMVRAGTLDIEERGGTAIVTNTSGSAKGKTIPIGGAPVEEKPKRGRGRRSPKDASSND